MSRIMSAVNIESQWYMDGEKTDEDDESAQSNEHHGYGGWSAAQSLPIMEAILRPSHSLPLVTHRKRNSAYTGTSYTVLSDIS